MSVIVIFVVILLCCEAMYLSLRWLLMPYVRWVCFYLDHKPECSNRYGRCNCGFNDVLDWLEKRGIRCHS